MTNAPKTIQSTVSSLSWLNSHQQILGNLPDLSWPSYRNISYIWSHAERCWGGSGGQASGLARHPTTFLLWCPTGHRWWPQPPLLWLWERQSALGSQAQCFSHLILQAPLQDKLQLYPPVGGALHSSPSKFCWALHEAPGLPETKLSEK